MVRDLHLREDSCAIIRDRDVSVGRNENFIESARSLLLVSPSLRGVSAHAYQRGLDNVRYCLRGQDVRLDCLVAMLPLLPALAVPCVSLRLIGFAI